ncbi:MAG: putative oxidoreductase C-terminal domain-containing protein, partial [Acidimicrobiales bacterium]
RGRIVVVAGRNEPKLAAIARLHQAGFAVLADKPWIVDSAGLPHLERATAGPPTVMDIMTGRHDVVNRLCRRIVATSELFGEFAGGRSGRPDLEFGSIHHLCKTVDGRPLIRPPWYYDVAVQGDGMVDIHSHLVDQAQWLVDASPTPTGGELRSSDHRTELRSSERRIESTGDDGGPAIERAERWSTPVPLADFAESTGEPRFPAAVADRVTGTGEQAVLSLACNGLIEYRLEGVSIRQQTVWHIRPPAGGSDRHSFTARGSGCTVTVSQGPETDGRSEVRLVPAADRDWPADLDRSLLLWQDEFPGLTAAPGHDGYRLTIPPILATPHEAMFGVVLDAFLDRVESDGWSAGAAATIRSRYRLLAAAHEIATGESQAP